MGKNRSQERKLVKMKLARMRKAGKLTSDAIEKERTEKVSRYATVVDKGKYDSFTIMPDGDIMPSGRHVESARGTIQLHKTVVNTGYDRRIHNIKPRSPGTLFRNRSGETFIVNDPLEEFIAHGLRAKKYSNEELLKLGQPDEEGWRKNEPVPLAETRRRMKQLVDEDGWQKWLYFVIRKEDHIHLALFFNPQKTQWIYVSIDPRDGAVQRTTILGSKNVAEFKRKNKKLTWIPVVDSQIQI